MSKGDKRRGNREAKKPKKVKEKVVATADFTKGKTLTNLGEEEITELWKSKSTGFAVIMLGSPTRHFLCLVRGVRLHVVTASQNIPLGRLMLAKDMAGEAFRDIELLHDVVDATTATGGAQKSSLMRTFGSRGGLAGSASPA
jgi:hypothetical protein